MSDFLTKCCYEKTARTKLCPVTENYCYGMGCQWWDKFSGGKKPSGWCTLPDHIDQEVVNIVRRYLFDVPTENETEARLEREAIMEEGNG